MEEIYLTWLIPDPTFREIECDGKIVLNVATKKVINELEWKEKICHYDSFNADDIHWETCPALIYESTGLYSYNGDNNISKAWIAWNVLRDWE